MLATKKKGAAEGKAVPVQTLKNCSANHAEKGNPTRDRRGLRGSPKKKKVFQKNDLLRKDKPDKDKKSVISAAKRNWRRPRKKRGTVEEGGEVGARLRPSLVVAGMKAARRGTVGKKEGSFRALFERKAVCRGRRKKSRAKKGGRRTLAGWLRSKRRISLLSCRRRSEGTSKKTAAGPARKIGKGQTKEKREKRRPIP